MSTKDDKFEKWYEENQRRFYCGHFDEKQVAYAAWVERGIIEKEEQARAIKATFSKLKSGGER